MSSDYKKMMKDGFRPMTEIETAQRFYFTKEVGSTLTGLLLSRLMRPGKEGEHFYEIEAADDCRTVSEHVMDNNGKSVENEASDGAKTGDIVRVDETMALQGPLMACLAKDTPQLVIIKCTAKVKLDGGARTFWRMQVWARDAS